MIWLRLCNLRVERAVSPFNVRHGIGIRYRHTLAVVAMLQTDDPQFPEPLWAKSRYPRTMSMKSSLYSGWAAWNVLARRLQNGEEGMKSLLTQTKNGKRGG